MSKIKIGISACLVRENFRYDGQDRRDHLITDTLGCVFEWVPVCPEVEYGLSVPREAMHLVGDPSAPHLLTIHTGIDHTSGMSEWSEFRVITLVKENLCGFILKSRSPSCGMAGVRIYRSSGHYAQTGVGLFAQSLMNKLPMLPIEEDERLHDAVLCEKFLSRILLYALENTGETITASKKQELVKEIYKYGN